ncbi:hypothetical protein [Paracoccus sp. ME4]|uniref:hypothetical protein n=1 Tax=Paracoccus sp. ME4 TaxID=3138066 RepID=UPI00398B9B7B
MPAADLFGNEQDLYAISRHEWLVSKGKPFHAASSVRFEETGQAIFEQTMPSFPPMRVDFGWR